MNFHKKTYPFRGFTTRVSEQRWRLAQQSEKDFWEKWQSIKKELLSYIVNEYWQYYINLIMKYVKINKGFRALDIGGGPYGIINFMNFKERHMLDPLADYYHDNYNFAHDIRLLQGKVEKMVYDDEYFDIIFCTNVLDHVQSITTAVGEIARVARRGGFLVLSVDCCAFLRRNARISLERLGLGEAAHPHTLSTKDVRNLLKLHGLSLLYQNKGIGTLGEYVWSKCGELWEKQTTTRTLMKVTLQLPVFSKDQFIFIASKSGGDKRDDEKSLNRGASV